MLDLGESVLLANRLAYLTETQMEEQAIKM
jgi:hypothetical protein